MDEQSADRWTPSMITAMEYIDTRLLRARRSQKHYFRLLPSKYLQWDIEEDEWEELFQHYRRLKYKIEEVATCLCLLPMSEYIFTWPIFKRRIEEDDPTMVARKEALILSFILIVFVLGVVALVLL